MIGIYFVLRPAPARHDRHVVELHTSKGSCSDNAILHAGSGPGIWCFGLPWRDIQVIDGSFLSH